jgi:gliding motility-associated-like protein
MEWDKVYGAEHWDELQGLVPISDGYMIGGRTSSGSLTATPNDTEYDFYLVRTDLDGNQLWGQSYGGREREDLWQMIKTNDGNFIMIGQSKSNKSASKSEDCRGEEDYWIVKVDPDGNQIWDKTFGGTGKDQAWDIDELQNGDLVITGASASPISGDKTDACRGSDDLWLLLLNDKGDLKWQTTIGGSRRELAYDMVITPDERYAYIVGGTESFPAEGEIGNDPRFGTVDLWVVKYDLKFQGLTWSHRYGAGPTGTESYAYRIIPSYDGNYIIGGASDADGGPTGLNLRKKTSDNIGGRDYWVFKMEPDGTKMTNYDLSLGTPGLDVCYGLYENFFGDLIITGVTDSIEGGNKNSERFGSYDIWTIALDRNWNQLWQKTLGGKNWDTSTRIVGRDDGSFVIGGHSASNKSGNKSEDTRGFNDLWVIKSACLFSDGIQNNTIIDPCTEQTLTLQAGADTCSTCVYFWSTGDSGPRLAVPPGFDDTVKLLVARRDGCLSRDTMYMNNPIPPAIELGPRDSSFIVGQSITIGGNNPQLQYLWGNGDTTATITVNYAGVYAVTVTDENGCTATDWMRVFQGEKEGVYIPNVFSPDSDGRNDYFNVYCDASVERVVNLQVFDRWGNGLFVHQDYPPNYETDGWDGTFRSRRMLPGAYRYHITVEFIDGSQRTYDGLVTIVR